MARDESNREDLLREATALVERIELAPAGGDEGEHVVIGFRAGGAMSVYFGDDAVYHFNSRGRLRRAYGDGLLFKAEHGTLIALERIRQENEVQLVRRPLPAAEQTKFLATMHERLGHLKECCLKERSDPQSLVTVGQVPANADVLRRVLDWLEHAQPITIARSPHAR